MFLKNIPLALFILSGFIYSSQVNAHPGSKRFCFDMRREYQKGEPVPYWYGSSWSGGGGGKKEQLRCMHSGFERHRGKKGKRMDRACHKHYIKRSNSEPNYWDDALFETKCRKTG